MATISLCTIVKNEEEMLPKCLESVKDFVDEIVIVDTGSTDNTVEIAKSFGARVLHFEWINDFSAARNFALDQCTTDYALVLDADEILYTEDLTKEDFLYNIEQLNNNIGLVPLHQAMSVHSVLREIVDGKARMGTPVLLPRIVPVDTEVRYVGIIHESPQSLNKQHALIITSLQVIHLGADPQWRESRNKSERNLELLMAAMDESDDITQYYSYLASELGSAGRRQEAFAMIEKGWNEYKNTPVENRRIGNSLVLTVYPTLLFLNNRQQDGFEALKFIFSQETNIFQLDPNVLYMTSRLLIDVDVSDQFKAELYETLEDVAQGLIDSKNVPFFTEQMSGIMDFKSKELLTHIKLKLGKLDEALQITEDLIQEFPDNHNYKLLLAECYLTLGSVEGVNGALQILLPLQEESKSLNDTYALSIAACVLMHDFTQNEDFWNMAIDFWICHQQNQFISFYAMHRSRFIQGFTVMKSLMDGHPIPGPGAYGVLGAIMSKQVNYSYTTVPKFIIRKAVYRMLELEKLHFIEPLLDPKAEETLSGINSFVREILEEIGVEIYDDDEPYPIFVGGPGCEIINDLFEDLSQLHIQKNFGYHNHLIPNMINYHEGKQLEKDPFEDAFNWLSDDEEIQDEDINKSIQTALVHLFNCLSQDSSKRFMDISEKNSEIYHHLPQVFPKGRVIHFIEDPREYVLRQIEKTSEPITDKMIESFCNNWLKNIHEFRNDCYSNTMYFFETTVALCVEQTQVQYERLLSFLGLLKEDITLPQLEDNQRWKHELSPQNIEKVETFLSSDLLQMGFEMTSNASTNIPENV